MKKILFLVPLLTIVLSAAFCAGLQSGKQQQAEKSEQKTAIQTVAQNQNNAVQSFQIENEEVVQIREEKGIKLRARNVEAHSDLNITPVQEQNRTRLRAHLSNGRDTEIKIMPDTASETALARLRLRVCNESNNCAIQLKEVGIQNQMRVVYQLQAQKEVKIFGFFRTRMRVQAQIDAETGELIGKSIPWWAAISTEVE